MKPILFNTEMVRAILDGRKMATRRIVKFPKHVKTQENGLYMLFADGTVYENQHFEEISDYIQPPFQKGDVLYVRETFAVGKIDCGELPDGRDDPYISQCPGENDIIPKEYAIRHDIGMDEVIWKPSLFMPKEAARIFLKVTDVRVERLQEITEGGARAEGAAQMPLNDIELAPATSNFAYIWNSTIKKSDLDRYGWNANPFVWVIEFERCEKESENK